MRGACPAVHRLATQWKHNRAWSRNLDSLRCAPGPAPCPVPTPAPHGNSHEKDDSCPPRPPRREAPPSLDGSGSSARRARTATASAPPLPACARHLPQARPRRHRHRHRGLPRGRRWCRVRPGRRSHRRPRTADQPPVDHHRCSPGDLHAGGLRPRRDRLLPGEARRTRRRHELRHLRPRLRRLLLHRLPARLRRLQLRIVRPDRAHRWFVHRQRQLDVPVAGRLGALR